VKTSNLERQTQLQKKFEFCNKKQYYKKQENIMKIFNLFFIKQSTTLKHYCRNLESTLTQGENR